MLGEQNSGKTAIFAKALNLSEQKLIRILRNGTHQSRFEEIIRVQRGTDQTDRFGMQINEINPHDILNGTG